MKRDKVFSRLAYTWWVYVVSAVVVICFWLLIFNQILKPKDNEKLLITFIGPDFDNAGLEADLNKKLPEISSQKIKNITVESLFNEREDKMSELLYARSRDADIIIVRQDCVISGMGEYYFRPVDTDSYAEAFGDVQFYEEDGTPYGILLYDGENANNFSKYYGAESKCWLFLTYNSPNTGGLNGTGEISDDSALKTVQWLLSD